MTMLAILLIYVVASMLAVPEISTADSVDRFFYISLAGVISVKITFFFFLLKDIDYYAAGIVPALTLGVQFCAALGLLYLYFNARMGTGIFDAI